MTAAAILTKTQAEAVYSAMCALNNPGGRLDAFLEGCFHVRSMTDGRVIVHRVTGFAHPPAAEPEIYADQAAFATAYGLQQG